MIRLSDFQAISWLLLCATIASNSHISNAQSLTPACGQANVRTKFGGKGDVPQQPCVPTLAYDQSSIWLVWNKPDNYASQQIVDYNVYMDGKLLGNTSSNAAKYSPAAPYFAAFYAEDKQANFHTKITQHSFKVTGLKSNTVYSFTIRSVQANGKVSPNSVKVVAKTAPAYVKIIDVSKQGAKGDGKTLNTVAIQNAINSCSNGSTSAFSVPRTYWNGKIGQYGHSLWVHYGGRALSPQEECPSALPPASMSSRSGGYRGEFQISIGSDWDLF